MFEHSERLLVMIMHCQTLTQMYVNCAKTCLSMSTFVFLWIVIACFDWRWQYMASHDVCLNWDTANFKYQLVDGIRVYSSIHVARV